MLKGYLNSTQCLMSIIKPDQVIHFFDGGKDKNRLQLHNGYKAGRKTSPDDFKKQQAVLKNLIEAMGHGQICQPGTEADDLIASVAQNLPAPHQVIIASGDKDFHQLLSPNVFQISPFKTAKQPPPSAVVQRSWMLLNEAALLEMLGLRPSQIVDFLSLMGDAADGIDGVHGVGEKRASQWIAQFGSIEGLLQNHGTLTPAFRQRVGAARELLERNRKLITLNRQLVVSALLQQHVSCNPVRLRALLDELEIRTAPSFLSMLFPASVPLVFEESWTSLSSQSVT
jgi:DNA polymerase-1